MDEPGRLLPRRLGLGVVPVPGESFPSWVDRMAVRMRTAPGWVVRELGMELLSSRTSAVLPSNYGISMSRGALEAVQAATGVTPDVVSAMLLSAYDGTVLDLSSLGRGAAGGTAAKLIWGLFRGSRCCPDCVTAGGGVWRLWWRLGGAAACPEHGMLLHGHCPRCGLPLRWGNYPLSVQNPYPPQGLTACLNGGASRRSVCGFSLAELSARPASSEVLAAQDLYLRAAAGQPMSLAGKEVAPAEWFAEMSQLVGLARLAGPQEFPACDGLPGVYAQAWREDHAAGKSRRTWVWRAPPSSPELAAALLHVLNPVLQAASEQEFRDRASWLIAVPYPRHGQSGPSSPAVLSPFTRRAFVSSRPPGRPRGFLATFLHPEPRLVRQGLTSACIPGYVNRDDVLEQVAPYIASKHGSRPGGWPQRRFAALCLVVMVSDVPTWEAAAKELRLPPLTLGDPVGKLKIADLLAFREGLIVVGHRLVERGLVDYRARRVALAGLTEMPAADLAGRPHNRNHSGWHDREQVFAAAWIWSELTGGRFDESPAWAAQPGFDVPAMPAGPRRLYTVWRGHQGTARLDWYRSWGIRYLDDRSRGGFPC